jgi:hypothetical protein
MDGKYFYEMANSQLNMTDRKLYLSTLTAEQRLLYTRYGAKLRQSKFNAKPEKREEYNEKRKDYKIVKRAEEPKKYQELNIKDVRAFRAREKAKQEAILNKLNAGKILTDAIRARKARKAMQIAAIENANKAANKLTDIGDIIKGLINEGKANIENKPASNKNVGRPRKARNPVGRPKKNV